MDITTLNYVIGYVPQTLKRFNQHFTYKSVSKLTKYEGKFGKKMQMLC